MSVTTFIDQALLRDLPSDRRWSYLCFSAALLVALGSHQFVGPVKTAVFMDVVGTDVEPVAKSLVLIVLVPVLIGYNVLVSLYNAPAKLVFAICGAYGAVYTVICLGLIASAGHPSPWIAWVLYYATETKGVIVMPMIWSVITDVTTPELAKKAYPPMFFIVQIGGILGSLLAIEVNDLGGEVGLLLMQTASFVIIAGLSWFACKFASSAASSEGEASAGGADAKLPLANAPSASGTSSAGACSLLMDQVYKGFEGLWLLLSRFYVFGAFWVSYANLMPRTILDYQNSVIGVQTFANRGDQIAFFGKVNMMINCGTALLTLVGTRPLVEHFGVGLCLLVLPVGMFLCICALCLGYSLWMSTVALVVVCILAYGLNSPCKEMLYVRTSREIKYKAKSWSEMYGNQLMKLLGAQMNLWVNRESSSCAPHCFHAHTTLLVTAAWVALWLAVAARLGARHSELEREDKIVS